MSDRPSRPAYVEAAYNIVSGDMEDGIGSLQRMAMLLQLGRIQRHSASPIKWQTLPVDRE